MEKLEKVVQALKCCRVNEDDLCEGNCPYAGKEDCIAKVMDDALELLEEISRRA